MPGSALTPDPDKYAAYCNELRLYRSLEDAPTHRRSRRRADLRQRNAALRHQLIILRRTVRGRVRLTNSDIGSASAPLVRRRATGQLVEFHRRWANIPKNIPRRPTTVRRRLPGDNGRPPRPTPSGSGPGQNDGHPGIQAIPRTSPSRRGKAVQLSPPSMLR